LRHQLGPASESAHFRFRRWKRKFPLSNLEAGLSNVLRHQLGPRPNLEAQISPPAPRDLPPEPQRGHAETQSPRGSARGSGTRKLNRLRGSATARGSDTRKLKHQLSPASELESANFRFRISTARGSGTRKLNRRGCSARGSGTRKLNRRRGSARGSGTRKLNRRGGSARGSGTRKLNRRRGSATARGSGTRKLNRRGSSATARGSSTRKLNRRGGSATARGSSTFSGIPNRDFDGVGSGPVVVHPFEELAETESARGFSRCEGQGMVSAPGRVRGARRN